MAMETLMYSLSSCKWSFNNYKPMITHVILKGKSYMITHINQYQPIMSMIMCSSLLFMPNTPEIVHGDAFGISYINSSSHQADPLFVHRGCTTTEISLARTSAGSTSSQLTAVENTQPTLSKGIR